MKYLADLLQGKQVNVATIGDWLWIKGEETREIKDDLKSIGFKWSGKKKAWYLMDYHLNKAINLVTDTILASTDELTEEIKTKTKEIKQTKEIKEQLKKVTANLEEKKEKIEEEPKKKPRKKKETQKSTKKTNVFDEDVIVVY